MNRFVVALYLLTTLICYCYAARSMFQSSTEKVEVSKSLNGLNKHPVKSIKSADGDIIDCIHMYHQPAFDHPLLKNHTIKMRPSYIPKSIKDDDIKNGSKVTPATTVPQLWHLNGKCPKGTIPIRRTNKEEAEFVNKYWKKKSLARTQTSSIPPQYDDERSRHEYATASTEGRLYGAEATFNVWNPAVQDSELSLSQVWLIGGGYETIEVGWQVVPSLYHDYNTKLFIFWTNDGYQSTACYNLDCQGGFIQNNHEIAIGGTIYPTSQVDGSQYDVTILVWKDPKDGDWWLQVNGNVLGYWPSSHFAQLSESATLVTWGGEIVNNKLDGYHTTTQMGSGYFSGNRFGKASYIKNIQVVDESTALRTPDYLTTSVSRVSCYDITMGGNDIEGWGTYFFFGGPGRNENCM